MVIKIMRTPDGSGTHFTAYHKRQGLLVKGEDIDQLACDLYTFYNVAEI